MKKDRNAGIIPTSSMADIAFLLLIFFLVTTTIANDIGLPLVLPPEKTEDSPIEIHDRNVLAILINSDDRILIESEEVTDPDKISDLTREFVLNHGADPASSESPDKAVISIRTDRNTTHRRFIQVLDEVHEGYHVIYAGRLGISEKEWLKILNSLTNPESKKLYNEARGVQPDGRALFPMQISIAEPVNAMP